MCLLVTQPAGTAFDAAFLAGVYKSNNDGIGIMYAEDGRVVVEKFLPSNIENFTWFYKTHIENKACAWHARMQTHGDVDLTNCHPYQVLSMETDGYDLWLMHNGVLSTGNAADVTKSDTWHYIADYLRPMLAGNHTFFMTDAFEEIVGSHISSGNKFVLVDGEGNMVTVNSEQGVKYNGAWLSNTYAWESTGKPYESCRPAPLYAASGYGGYGGYGGYKGFGYSRGFADEYDYDYFEPVGKPATSTATKANYTTNYDSIKRVDDWSDAFFETIEDIYLPSEVAKLTWRDVDQYYYAVGDDAAMELLDMIPSWQLDFDDVMQIVRGKVSVFELDVVEQA